MSPEETKQKVGDLSLQLSAIASTLSEFTASSRSILAEVKQRSTEAAKAASGEMFKPLFSELLLAVDRLRIEVPSEELNQSVAEEILDICAHYGLEEVDSTGEFNPRVHEVASIIATGDQAQNQMVVSVERPGFKLAGALLRPARVVIARYEQSLDSENLGDSEGLANSAIDDSVRHEES